MQGATIMDFCSHFEDKIENNTDNDNETVANDCHSICASLLTCAGFMAPDNRKDLCSQLSDHLKAYSKKSHEERSRLNVVPYLAVFCSWGMHQEVAKSLARAITSAFCEDEDIQDTSSSLPASSSARRGKRKQSDMQSDKNGLLVIPRLPSDVAVHLIGQVLRGRDPSSLVIRDALMSSEEASSAIANALEKATIAAEHVINGSVSNFMALMYNLHC